MCNLLFRNRKDGKSLVGFTYPRSGGAIIKFARSTRHPFRGELLLEVDGDEVVVTMGGESVRFALEQVSE